MQLTLEVTPRQLKWLKELLKTMDWSPNGAALLAMVEAEAEKKLNDGFPWIDAPPENGGQ